MTLLLDQIDQQNAVLAPAFVMVDPFGPKGSRMSLIERILRNPKSECLISFMYEPIRRFHTTGGYEEPLNELFGTEAWKECFDIEDEPERNRFLHDLFTRQLKRHGAKYVVTFELYRGNHHIYTLYFTTGDLKGCDLMKSCIWKLDPGQGVSFRAHAQRDLFSLRGADTDHLARQLRDRFGNQWTPIGTIEDFVKSDATPFHKGQLRQATLQPLERDSKIEVQRPQGGKGFTSGRGIRLRFK
ncbi:MAG: three-Cys-motif partner protein TcmP [Gammaproteobacteria bacterium]|nr:three-Cys-motif partner protein TcmP [Gammaproteobacteria bacterium]